MEAQMPRQKERRESPRERAPAAATVSGVQEARRRLEGSLYPAPEERGSARGRTVLRVAKATAAPGELAGREGLLEWGETAGSLSGEGVQGERMDMA